MAAATALLSLHFSIDKTHFPKLPHFSLPFNKPTYTISSSLPQSSSTQSSSSMSSSLTQPLLINSFLSDQDLISLQKLEDFTYFIELASGELRVRVMRPDQVDVVVSLLAESFADSIMFFSGLSGYVTLLGILVKQYLVERQSLMPHTATLVGFYKENGDEKLVLSGTVEVCFDRIGASVSPPTPTPPKDSPYICNMSVKKTLRRRGIGWHLLKASEQLIAQMSSSGEVYLHCRMIDTAPLNMYTKAGYSIVKTDSFLILLTLQRRKHLMRKALLVSESPFPDIVDIGIKSS